MSPFLPRQRVGDQLLCKGCVSRTAVFEPLAVTAERKTAEQPVELFRFVDHHGDEHHFHITESEARRKWARDEVREPPTADGEVSHKDFAYFLDEEGNFMDGDYDFMKSLGKRIAKTASVEWESFRQQVQTYNGLSESLRVHQAQVGDVTAEVIEGPYVLTIGGGNSYLWAVGRGDEDFGSGDAATLEEAKAAAIALASTIPEGQMEGQMPMFAKLRERLRTAQGSWKIIDRYSGEVVDTSPTEDDAFGLAEMKFGDNFDLDAVIQGPTSYWLNGSEVVGQWGWTSDEYVADQDRQRRGRRGRKLAHDSGDGETLYHCPFCGAGQLTGRSDGTAECGFCGTTFTVQVQPKHNTMPQTIDGVPQQMPDMPGGPGEPGVPVDETEPQETELDLDEDGEGEVKSNPFPFNSRRKQALTPSERQDAMDDAVGQFWISSQEDGRTLDGPYPTSQQAYQVAEKHYSDQPVTVHRAPAWALAPNVPSGGPYYLNAEGVAMPEDSFIRHLAVKHAAPEDRLAVLRQIKAER